MNENIKLAIEHLLTPEEYPTNPHCLEIPADGWKEWLRLQSRTTNWWLKKPYISSVSPAIHIFVVLIWQLDPATKWECTYVWKNTYICDHAGDYRDRWDANLSPQKWRKRAESIKCNCKAKINISQQTYSERVFVEYHWKHDGHSKLPQS